MAKASAERRPPFPRRAAGDAGAPVASSADCSRGPGGGIHQPLPPLPAGPPGPREPRGRSFPLAGGHRASGGALRSHRGGGAGSGGAAGAPGGGAEGAGSEAPRAAGREDEVTGLCSGPGRGGGRPVRGIRRGRGAWGAGPGRPRGKGRAGRLGAHRAARDQKCGKVGALTPHSWRPRTTPSPLSRTPGPGSPESGARCGRWRPESHSRPQAFGPQPGRAWPRSRAWVAGAQGSASGPLSSAVKKGCEAPSRLCKEPKLGARSWASLRP